MANPHGPEGAAAAAAAWGTVLSPVDPEEQCFKQSTMALLKHFLSSYLQDFMFFEKTGEVGQRSSVLTS